MTAALTVNLAVIQVTGLYQGARFRFRSNGPFTGTRIADTPNQRLTF